MVKFLVILILTQTKAFDFKGAYQGPFYSARHLSLIKTFLASVHHSLLLLNWESRAKQKCVKMFNLVFLIFQI